MNVGGTEIKIEGRLIRIARLDADKFLFLEDPEPVLDGLRKSGTRIDLFTFMQALPKTSPTYSYPMEWDNFAAVPISTYEHWWDKQIESRVRVKVRKAQKTGVVVRAVPFDDVLVRGIWEVYNECPVRQGQPYGHYGKDIDTVRMEEATYLEHSFFLGAFVQDKLIGFAKLITNESRTQTQLLNIISMVKHRDRSPTNALIEQAVRWCAEQKIPYLVYGRFTYGKKQGDSLSEFKKHNGFQRFDLPRYYVPLTRLGWVAFRLGLHKRLADHLPEAILSRFRDLRSGWYSRKLQSATKV